MNLYCTLGLAACMSFNGQTYRAETAVGILDTCDMLNTAPVSTFVMHPAKPGQSLKLQMRRNAGALMGRTLEKDGLTLEWPPSPVARKARWQRTCRQFQAAFDRKSSWTHLEKWPF